MRLRREQDEPRSDDLGRLSAEELSALIGAARAVNGASGVRETLETILDAAIELLGADEGSVLLFDDAAQSLRIAAARGLSPEVVEQTRVARGQGFAGRVAHEGRALLLGEEASPKSYERDRPLRSAVCVPLEASGRIEGVLCVNVIAENTEHPGFDEHDLALGTAFGEHAAATVGARRLVDHADRRRRDLEALYELGRALVWAHDEEAIGAALVDAAIDTTTASGAVLARSDGPGWRVVAVTGLHRGRVVAALRRAPRDWAEGSPAVIEDLVGDEVLAPLASDPTSVAEVAPLEAGGAVSAILVTIHPARPSDRVRAQLHAMADQARLALAAVASRADVERKGRELERIVHTIPDPVLLIGADGRLITLNPAAAERLGLNEHSVAAAPVEGRLGSAELEQIVRSPTSERAEVVIGGYTFRVRVSLVEPERGRGSARVVSLQDITTESELRRLKSDFVAVMGHELRTPLTLVKGYASTLAQRGDELPPEMRERVMTALNQHTLRLERLIEDLLLVAGIERGRAPLSLDECDLVEVVREQVDVVSTEHPERRISVETEVEALRMRFDRVKVEQVIHHLLSNALKFSEADTPITVSVSADEEHGLLAVRDEGIGIYSGDIPHLFDRFRQLDGTGTRAHGGTGVGLYICRTLVEAHGGRIDVRSALSRGSTFTVVLPRSPQEDPPAPGAAVDQSVSTAGS